MERMAKWCVLLLLSCHHYLTIFGSPPLICYPAHTRTRHRLGTRCDRMAGRATSCAILFAHSLSRQDSAR